jgi:hypothetical protein
MEKREEASEIKIASELCLIALPPKDNSYYILFFYFNQGPFPDFHKGEIYGDFKGINLCYPVDYNIC